MTSHQRLGTTHTEERHRAWHSIIAFGQHKRSDDVGRGMPSPPLDITHDRMTSGVGCHHRPSTMHTEGQRRAWQDLTALGQHTRSDYIGHGMTSPPLDSTHGLTTSGVACHHRLWEAHTIERCRVWHAIISFGKHTRSNDVGRGMTSMPLDNTHGRQRQAWHDITALGQHTWSAMLGVA